MSRAILRNFKQFAYDMKIGDLVVIGVGQMTKFNIHSIVKVVGEYEYKNVGGHPRHYRRIELVDLPSSPIPYEEFNRLSRLEYLSKYDWTEMMNHIRQSNI
jgi:predicted Mrr-cat superfamily restriction endonuclease